MPADRAPGRPGPGEGFGHKFLRRVLVIDTHQDGQEAFILGPAVELRKVQSFSSHTPSTHDRRAPVTWRPEPSELVLPIRPANAKVIPGGDHWRGNSFSGDLSVPRRPTTAHQGEAEHPGQTEPPDGPGQL